MPLIASLILVLLVSLLLASLLAGPMGWRHGRAGDRALASWFFSLMILLPFVWVATVWLPPAGPALAGVHWIGPLVAGLLIAFLLAALAPDRRTLHEPADADARTDAIARDGTAVRRRNRSLADLLFWIFLLLAVGVVVLGYLV